MYDVVLFLTIVRKMTIIVECVKLQKTFRRRRKIKQAVIDLPGNRENPLDFTLRYDGGRLVYCKEAKGKGLKGLSVVSGLSETGEMLLEISALTGNRFWGGGKIILEFYVKKPCRDMYEYLKLCDEKLKKVKNPCCRIDNDFRKNYNDGNGFRKNKKADEN